jgi:beta-N-acetylhexosaminidase
MFLSVILLILAGCSVNSGTTSANDSQVGIRGIIKDINISKDGANILVEGKIEADTVFDKASVNINTDTMIQKDNLSRLFEISDLKLGDKVEVFFKGPVAESYPVQGTADIVRIITQ